MNGKHRKKSFLAVFADVTICLQSYALQAYRDFDITSFGFPRMIEKIRFR